MKLATRFSIVSLLIVIAQLTGSSHSLRAQTEEEYQVRELTVWIQDPTVPKVNDRERYDSPFPALVENLRSRTGTSESIQPFGLLTFQGSPVQDMESNLQLKTGRVLASWPKATVKSRRIRWPGMNIRKPTANDESEFTYLTNSDHWFSQLRNTPGNLVVELGARTESFIAYDIELEWGIPLVLTGSGGEYHLTSQSSSPLHDIVIIAPDKDGVRIGTLAKLDAGKTEQEVESEAAEKANETKSVPGPKANQPIRRIAPAIKVIRCEQEPVDEQKDTKETEPTPAKQAPTPVTITMSKAEPLSSFKENAAATLRKLWSKTGLRKSEIELLLKLYGPALLEPKELVVLARLDREAVDKMTALDFFPEPTRISRTNLMIFKNLDPALRTQVAELVGQLGSESYVERESAENRLNDLGAIAVQSLKAALKNSDLEIVFRAERILVRQGVKLPD